MPVEDETAGDDATEEGPAVANHQSVRRTPDRHRRSQSGTRELRSRNCRSFLPVNMLVNALLLGNRGGRTPGSVVFG